LRLLGRRYPSPLAFFPWRILNGIFYKRVVFPTYTQWDIYHSPFNPLPPVSWTGNAIRFLTVHDCIHLKSPDMAPEIPAPVSHSLNSVDTSRDYVICDSEYTRQDMLTFLPIAPERTRVIPLAASKLFTQPRKELAYPLLQAEGISPGKYVLALGQLEPRKNILALARAFRDAYKQGHLQGYVLLLTTARGGQRTALFKQILALGLPETAIKIVFDVDDEMLAALYACAGLFAYVSLYEGFGIPPLEAMSAGCPVLVSHTSSLPEVVGEAGEYVDPHDTESIAAGMIRILHDQELRASLIERGKAQAARFAWQTTAAKTLEFYQEAHEMYWQSAQNR
jgi:glycosyltransferase involved in cell wall biosynthesis